MAKTGFWLRGAKGKLAGSVLYQANGSTIQREIVKPNNPQSDNQMRQRIGFAAASKFYQQAQQNRFVLAFPNKASNQSTFNAWMSENLRALGTLIYPTKDQVNNPNFCGYFPWVCSKGNLGELKVVTADDYTDLIGVNIKVYDTDNSRYYRSWDELIEANPALQLQYGDIITLTAVFNDMHFDGANVSIGQNPATWVTRQFIIGDDLGSGTLGDYLEKNDFQEITTPDGSDIAVGFDMATLSHIYENINYSPVDSQQADAMPVMACVTRSRMVNGKLKVSNSSMWCSFMAQQIYTRLSYDSQLYEAIESYKGTSSDAEPTNILEGSVAKSAFTFDRLEYTGGGGMHYEVKALGLNITGIQVRKDEFSQVYVQPNVYYNGDLKVMSNTGNKFAVVNKTSGKTFFIYDEWDTPFAGGLNRTTVTMMLDGAPEASGTANVELRVGTETGPLIATFTVAWTV